MTDTTTISKDRLRLMFNDELTLVGKVKSLKLELADCKADKAELQSPAPLPPGDASGADWGVVLALVLGAAAGGLALGFLARDRIGK